MKQLPTTSVSMFDQPDYQPKRKKSKLKQAKKAKKASKMIEAALSLKPETTLKHSEEVVQELARFFIKQIEIEKLIEGIKCELALYPEFNLA